jgi:hypothetical protein
MKAGDIVHVPSNVTLVRELPCNQLVLTKYFETCSPKKAIFLKEINDSYVSVEYGEHTWMVRRQDITLLENKNDC